MRLYCITGMHRSGTSAMARLINLLGVELGSQDDLLPPAPDNPKGFWEHRGLKRISDLVLEHLGGTWQELPAFPPGYADDPDLDHLREEALGILQEMAGPGAEAPVGFKDPRVSLLADFWATVAPLHHVVVAVRHPVEVAASLHARNEMPEGRAAELWLAYTARALTTLHDPTMLVYADLLEDPIATGRRLADRMGLPHPDATVEEQLAEFVDPSLRHHQATTASPEPAMNVAVEVYQALRQDDRTQVTALLDYLAGTIPSSMAHPRTVGRLETVQAELEDNRRARVMLENARERLDAARREVHGLQVDLDRLQAQRVAQGKQLDETRRALQSTQRDLTRLRNRRSVQLALRMAEPARPVFRGVRKVRRALGRDSGGPALPWPTGETASVAPPAWRYERQAVPDAAIHALADAHPTVVVPIHNAPAEVEACIESLLRNTTMPADLLLIDDASTDPAIPPLLARYDALPGIRVLRNDDNLGFTGTVNRGMQESTGDVVLLNSDTRVTPRWLQRLVLAAHADDRIASATPLSNNAGAFSAPVLGQPNATPATATDDAVGRLVGAHARHRHPDTPTGNGFCMYLRRAALDEVGQFDQAAFPRGYGEENDWSMRALAKGWRHVVADDAYVLHVREASFGAEKASLAEAGRAVVDERHPDYSTRVRAFVNAPEMERARDAVRRAFDDDAVRVGLPRTLYVIHHGGGGATSTNLDLMRVLPAGRERYVLSSDTQRLRLLRVHPGGEELLDELDLGSPLRFWDPSDSRYRQFAASALVGCGIELVHVRHLIKHTLDVPILARQLHIPTVFSFHDFYMSCPTVHLLDDQDRFCGGTCTPGDGACRIPMAWIERDAPHLKHAGVHDWRDMLRPHLTGASALVTTSDAARDVYLNSYPELDPDRFHIIEHGRDLEQTHGARAPRPGEPIRILLPGNLDVHKGQRVVEALSEIDRDERLEFHFLGRTPSELGRIGTLHGTYTREDFADRVAEIAPAFIGLLSICAETYSHALSEAWAAGVPVLVSPLGALGERVERHGGGWVVPIDDPEALYRQILEIADDPDAWAEQQDLATTASLRTVHEMATDYERLYRRAVSGARRFQPDHRPARVAAFVVGGTGPHHPGTVHVRTLRRLTHPDLAHDVEPTVALAPDLLDGTVRPDVVLVQRTGVEPALVPDLVQHCRDTDTPLVFELDDNLLDTSHLPEDQGHWEEHVPALRQLASEASLVTVSTPTLVEVVRPLNDQVALVPNMLDERLWFAPTDGGGASSSPAEVRILYMGTRTHGADLALLRPAVEQLQVELDLEVVLEVIGGEEPGRGQDWYQRLDVPSGRAGYPEFVAWLRSQRHRWTFAVAPLADTEFNAYKSDLKFLEYSALGLSGVYSDVGPYAATVEHDVTGLLADNTVEGWLQQLRILATDAEVRERLAGAATTHVAQHRTLRRHLPTYAALLRGVTEVPAESTSPAAKLTDG